MMNVSSASGTYTAHDIAAILQSSVDHVRRMDRRGQMPPSSKVGKRLVRWSKNSINQWVENGCPDCSLAGNEKGGNDA